MHQQDLALGLRPGHGQTLQMQGDAVALQREGLDLIFRGGISTGLDRGDLKEKSSTCSISRQDRSERIMVPPVSAPRIIPAGAALDEM